MNKLKKKLSPDRDNFTEYNNVMKDQLKNGILEKAEGPGNPRKAMCLPHQAVIHKDHSSTKLRVVFDASAKKVGPTLNDAMYKGPCWTLLLFAVLVPFRLNPIGIIANIEKAYLQISVADCHRDFVRFLWFDDVFKDIPEEVMFRFCRVIFGANCSQYLLNSVIRYHASQYKDIDKNFSEKVAKSFYVDDFNSTVDNVTQGEELYKKIKLRFLDASFNVRKWKTNSLELQNYIDKMERSISASSDTQNSDKTKVLGIAWDTINDYLVYSFEDLVESFKSVLPTKRSILGLVAKFYDPVSLIQPAINKLKLFFQEVCLTTGQLKKNWRFIVKLVENLAGVCINICYFYDIELCDYIVSYQLHGFSDASEKAYGCCIYLKCITKNNFISSSLVASKSRVAPIERKLSIPCLELLGNLILSRLILTVLNAFQGEIIISCLYAWTDSQVSSAWIKTLHK